MPRAVIVRMKAEADAMDRDDAWREAELRRKIEAYLDAGHGSCLLKSPDVAEMVIETWFRFDGERYRLLEWVVMPNHCHVLIEPIDNFPLSKIVLSWKNYTARFINSRPDIQPQHPVWQRDYWDRFIRNESHLLTVREYITMNPVKAGLAASPEEWPWGSAAARRSAA
ncbi:REP-associated tyrosine transposase [Desulfonatronum parangueonense]